MNDIKAEIERIIEECGATRWLVAAEGRDYVAIRRANGDCIFRYRDKSEQGLRDIENDLIHWMANQREIAYDAARAEAAWYNLPEQRLRVDTDNDGQFGDWASVQLRPQQDHGDHEAIEFMTDAQPDAVEAMRDARATQWGKQSAYVIRRVVKALREGKDIPVEALEAYLTRIEGETR
jgi:hypothetical protein